MHSPRWATLRHVTMVVEYVFRKVKDPKHPLHYLLPLVKMSRSEMFVWPTYPYQLPLGKTTR